MLINKGQLLFIEHSRKGKFYGRAKRDFDTAEEFYPIVSDEIRSINGLNNSWENGEAIPCRKSLCKIKVIKDKNGKSEKGKEENS